MHLIRDNQGKVDEPVGGKGAWFLHSRSSCGGGEEAARVQIGRTRSKEVGKNRRQAGSCTEGRRLLITEVREKARRNKEDNGFSKNPRGSDLSVGGDGLNGRVRGLKGVEKENTQEVTGPENIQQRMYEWHGERSRVDTAENPPQRKIHAAVNSKEARGSSTRNREGAKKDLHCPKKEHPATSNEQNTRNLSTG